MTDDPSPLVDGGLDPSKAVFVFVCGRKGTGKTELAKSLYRSYPYDELAIDPTHDMTDLGPSKGPERVETFEDLPSRWPERDEDAHHVRLRYLPDPGSPTYEDDLDRAVGLAFFHPDRRCLCLIDEIAEVTSANKVGPHMRRALHQGRHRNLTLIMCGPRPIDVNPLCISQADYVYIFDLPNPKDRERVAGYMGWPPKDLDARVGALGEHEYLRYETATKELTHWPALPLGRGRRKAS